MTKTVLKTRLVIQSETANPTPKLMIEKHIVVVMHPLSGSIVKLHCR